MHRLPLIIAILLTARAALAVDGVSVRRGTDAVVFGHCVPSLTVENRSGETIDYFQVDLVLLLANGKERVVELKSAYRDGVLFPIAPGGQATLKQHLDMSLPVGATCTDIKARKVARTICESAGGKPCSIAIQVDP